MHDQVGQNEDQIMQEDDPNYRSVRDRSRSLIERNTRGEQSNLENETIT